MKGPKSNYFLNVKFGTLRLEKGRIDIQNSTLFKLFEDGLGKKLGLTIQ
jgi:hypothetical protein